MINLSVNRSSLSRENISILSRIVEINPVKKDLVNDMENRNNFNNNNSDNFGENLNSNFVRKDFQDTALGVLYKNLHENKNSQKPLIYFFIGLIVGVLSTLFLTAVVFVSDKEAIESDVKTVKETIIETEKDALSEKTAEQDSEVESSDVLTNENGQKTYTVKQGDTLGGIVNRLYGSSYDPSKVEKFKEVNGLKSIHVLQIGQVLIIPD